LLTQIAHDKRRHPTIMVICQDHLPPSGEADINAVHPGIPYVNEVGDIVQPHQPLEILVFVTKGDYGLPIGLAQSRHQFRWAPSLEK
jgi:hypothetical protein